MATPITLGQIPPSFSTDQAAFLQTLINAINVLQTSVVAPNPPTNVQVTPIANGNLIEFTRSNGDSYSLYRNTVNSFKGSQRFDLGLAASYTDVYGTSGVKLYYWVKAKLGQLASTLVGPVAGTTLSQASNVVQPVTPAASASPTNSDLEGTAVPGNPGVGVYVESL